MKKRFFIILIMVFVSCGSFADNELGLTAEENEVINAVFDIIYLVDTYDDRLTLKELVKITKMMGYIETVIDDDGEFNLKRLKGINKGIGKIAKKYKVLLPSKVAAELERSS